VHFVVKENLFETAPFTLDGLSERLSERQPHETALKPLHDWITTTMTEAETDPSWTDISENGAPCERTASILGPSWRPLLYLRARSRRSHWQRPR
jgi:hypothetical protein